MLVIYINGVDVTDRVSYDGSFRISDNVNQQRDTFDFIVKKAPGQSAITLKGEEVYVEFDSVRVFGGIITSVNQTVEGVNLLINKCQAVDYSFDADRKLVLERYEAMTVNDIIDDLVTTYAPTFTTTAVGCTFLVDSIVFNRIKISECLQKLAEMTGYAWYIDAYKDIHFFAKNDEAAPFSLTDTSENYIWESLEISDDLSQIRNSITVEGGEVEGNSLTEEFTASGTADERQYVRLAHKFAELPTLVVGGVSKTVGVEFLNDDTLFQAMWDFNQKYIRFTAGNVPAAATVIEVTGIPLYKLIGRLNNSTSILEHGTYEFPIKDNTIRSSDALKERALAELDAYKNGVIEGSFSTYESGLRSGQVITINSALRGVNETFLIQSVTFTMLGPETEGFWSVRLATLRTVGIIEFLQKLLRDNRSTSNTTDTELLLSFFSFSDAANADDNLVSIATKTGPYLWDDAPVMWNRFTWA